jgi:parvulin-like peptidyl-prolyl isomerase
LGDRLLVEAEFQDESEQSIASTFGPEFARAVFSLKPGAWSGPIDSGYGPHLVRVSTRDDARLRPFSDVRERVVEEWRREQEAAANERYLAELHKKYGLVVDDAIKPLVAPAAAAKAVRP